MPNLGCFQPSFLQAFFRLYALFPRRDSADKNASFFCSFPAGPCGSVPFSSAFSLLFRQVIRASVPMLARPVSSQRCSEPTGGTFISISVQDFHFVFFVPFIPLKLFFFHRFNSESACTVPHPACFFHDPMIPTSVSPSALSFLIVSRSSWLSA